jgi:hypothetical protein
MGASAAPNQSGKNSPPQSETGSAGSDGEPSDTASPAVAKPAPEAEAPSEKPNPPPEKKGFWGLTDEGWIALGTVGLFLSTSGLWFYTAKMWGQTKRLAEDAELQFGAEHRPWLAITALDLAGNLHIVNGSSEIVGNIAILNTGSAPALGVVLKAVMVPLAGQAAIQFQTTLARTAYERRAEPGTVDSSFVLFPQQPLTQTRTFKAAIEDFRLEGDQRCADAFLIVVLCYRSPNDKNSEVRSTSATWVMSGIPPVGGGTSPLMFNPNEGRVFGRGQISLAPWGEGNQAE